MSYSVVDNTLSERPRSIAEDWARLCAVTWNISNSTDLWKSERELALSVLITRFTMILYSVVYWDITIQYFHSGVDRVTLIEIERGVISMRSTVLFVREVFLCDLLLKLTIQTVSSVSGAGSIWLNDGLCVNQPLHAWKFQTDLLGAVVVTPVVDLFSKISSTPRI